MWQRRACERSRLSLPPPPARPPAAVCDTQDVAQYLVHVALVTFHTRRAGAAWTEGSDSQRHIVYILPPLAMSETEPFLTGRLLLCFFFSLPSLLPFLPQKSDHGQVLLDVVFKHLELTERDYFGLHLADDSLDTPVSGRGRGLPVWRRRCFYQLWCLCGHSSIIQVPHAVQELSLSVCASIFYSAGWIPTSPSGNS